MREGVYRSPCTNERRFRLRTQVAHRPRLRAASCGGGAGQAYDFLCTAPAEGYAGAAVTVGVDEPTATGEAHRIDGHPRAAVPRRPETHELFDDPGRGELRRQGDAAGQDRSPGRSVRREVRRAGLEGAAEHH